MLSDFAICAAVATLSTTAPASAGSPPDGTSLPVHTFISCFSAPCGYLVFNDTTFIFGYLEASFVIISIQSGLLSYIPMYPFSTLSIFSIALSPSTTSLVCSNINLWSAVRYGSHSAPFNITASTVLSFGGFNFT